MFSFCGLGKSLTSNLFSQESLQCARLWLIGQRSHFFLFFCNISAIWVFNCTFSLLRVSSSVFILVMEFTLNTFRFSHQNCSSLTQPFNVAKVATSITNNCPWPIVFRFNLAVGSSSIAPESAGGSSRHFLGNKSRHCPAIVPPAAAVHPCHYLWVE